MHDITETWGIGSSTPIVTQNLLPPADDEIVPPPVRAAGAEVEDIHEQVQATRLEAAKRSASDEARRMLRSAERALDRAYEDFRATLEVHRPGWLIAQRAAIEKHAEGARAVVSDLLVAIDKLARARGTYDELVTFGQPGSHVIEFRPHQLGLGRSVGVDPASIARAVLELIEHAIPKEPKGAARAAELAEQIAKAGADAPIATGSDTIGR